jgi:hypothetical protein
VYIGAVSTGGHRRVLCLPVYSTTVRLYYIYLCVCVCVSACTSRRAPVHGASHSHLALDVCQRIQPGRECAYTLDQGPRPKASA